MSFFKNPKKTSQGFTLVEVLIAITIVSVIFGVIISSTLAVQKSGRDAQRQSDLRAIQSALQQFYADNNYYPDTHSILWTGTRRYTTQVSDPIPRTSTPYCYEPQVGFIDGPTSSSRVRCNNSSTVKCHYYLLLAKLESPPAGGASYNCGGASGYNFFVTPIKS